MLTPRPRTTGTPRSEPQSSSIIRYFSKVGVNYREVTMPYHVYTSYCPSVTQRGTERTIAPMHVPRHHEKSKPPHVVSGYLVNNSKRPLSQRHVDRLDRQGASALVGHPGAARKDAYLT